MLAINGVCEECVISRWSTEGAAARVSGRAGCRHRRVELRMGRQGGAGHLLPRYNE